MTTQQQTWIITGATRGFGYALTLEALRRGDNVVAAVRRPTALDEIVAEWPGRVAVCEFDAASTDGVDTVVDIARERFGNVDVLVNNAGQGIVGAAEEVSEAELRAGMDLHLHVPAALVRAVLPTMRAQGSGTIVQMSSQGGRLSFPGIGAYSAGKFALEGWSEALAGEVAPFGIRVMLVEPSRFRTAFNEPDVLRVVERSSVYGDLLDDVRANMAAGDGVQEGDPARAARIIADVVHGPDVPLRLPLGAEAVRRIDGSHRAGLANVERWAETAVAADFPGVPASVRPF
ncbi:putative oxidoreductase [Gordonia effusa NBRC 100432]|uniref:Putative oxidoreductase n=1 Tax=Gordonia effusa NBRC 100432 TaxID=1077974 RepID=H0R3G3_9ACTN|nr:SDR family oxidoreductase [Gordonia effusa]GAB19614.1 putative oxidoreductase [Gordonia effusa NBRC 100432]